MKKLKFVFLSFLTSVYSCAPPSSPKELDCSIDEHVVIDFPKSSYGQTHYIYLGGFDFSSGMCFDTLISELNDFISKVDKEKWPKTINFVSNLSPFYGRNHFHDDIIQNDLKATIVFSFSVAPLGIGRSFNKGNTKTKYRVSVRSAMYKELEEYIYSLE